MGIKQLNKIIKKYSGDAISEKNIQSYKHKKIALDSSILLYKYRYADNGSDNSHINGFIQKACFYLKHGILPVFVFDGIPPIEKKQTLDERFLKKNKVEIKIQTLISSIQTIESETCGLDTSEGNTEGDTSEGNTEGDELDNKEREIINNKINIEITKLKKQITYVTKTHRQECKYIVKLLGLPYIEATGEAENTCACLQKAGIVDYTYTEDTDLLTFGAPSMLKSAKKLEKVIEIDLSIILSNLNFTMDEFIDFCILCGCDYCPTIPKIGPITALKLIQEYSTIEVIIENINDKYNIPENFDYTTARKLFKHNPIEKTKYDLSIGDIKLDKLKEFILNEKNFGMDVLDGMLWKFNKSLLEYKKHHSSYGSATNGRDSSYGSATNGRGKTQKDKHHDLRSDPKGTLLNYFKPINS